MLRTILIGFLGIFLAFPGPSVARDMDAPSCSEAYAHLHFVVRPLHFAAKDLVYGASAGGRLRALQQRAGGRLLTDIDRPMGLTTEAFSLEVLDQAVKEGHTIHFDLTHITQLSEIFSPRGALSEKVTTQELLHIRRHWHRFKNNVKFYYNDVQVAPPWIK